MRLAATLIVTMLGHGYLSIQQDRENLLREMRVGMIGLSRSIQAALRYMYGDASDIKATQSLICELVLAVKNWLDPIVDGMGG